MIFKAMYKLIILTCIVHTISLHFTPQMCKVITYKSKIKTTHEQSPR